MVGVKSLQIVVAQSPDFENAQCNFKFAQIPSLHGTETLDLSQCDHANSYDTMEPELSCLISPRCELGESHTGNITMDSKLSQRDLDNPTCHTFSST